MSAMSWPSITILPSAESIIRNNADIKEDFPAPVLPMTPTYKQWFLKFKCIFSFAYSIRQNNTNIKGVFLTPIFFPITSTLNQWIENIIYVF